MENSKIAIITDTTSDIPDELLKEHSIYEIPMRIVFKDAEFRDKFEIKPKQIYDRLEDEIPTSSLPYSEDVQKVMEELIGKGYTDVIFITLSSGLSGTNNMVNLMMEDYKDRINVKVVDSLYLSLGLGFQVLECAKVIKDKGSAKEALKAMDEVRKSMIAMFVVKTLHYLKKGGRIGKVEGTVGDMLHLKPVISINEEGVYYTLSKVRGRKKSIQKMIDALVSKYKDRQINVGVVQGMAKEEAEELLSKLKTMLNIKSDMLVQISPVLGMHTGPGLLGVIAYETK